MFDFESITGKVFIKDNRLRSYEWTHTGIKLMIPDIDEKKNSGKYQGDVATEQQHNQAIIEIKDIIGKLFLLCLPLQL